MLVNFKWDLVGRGKIQRADLVAGNEARFGIEIGQRAALRFVGVHDEQQLVGTQIGAGNRRKKEDQKGEKCAE